MNFAIFYDAVGQYVAENIVNSVSHLSLFSTAIDSFPKTELLTDLKNAPFDAFLIAIRRNATLEKVLFAIRESEINKPIFIVKLSTLQRRLPIIEEEVFLKNRVEQLKPNPQGGGGMSLI